MSSNAYKKGDELFVSLRRLSAVLLLLLLLLHLVYSGPPSRAIVQQRRMIRFARSLYFNRVPYRIDATVSPVTSPCFTVSSRVQKNRHGDAADYLSSKGKRRRENTSAVGRCSSNKKKGGSGRGWRFCGGGEAEVETEREEERERENRRSRREILITTCSAQWL